MTDEELAKEVESAMKQNASKKSVVSSAKPTLKTEEVRGLAQPGSPHAVRREKDHSLAEEALQTADIQRLYALYEKTVKDRKDSELALDHVMTLVGSKDEKNAIQALEIVKVIALAAIDLAKSVALKSNDVLRHQ